MNTPTRQERIARNFSRSAATYDRAAAAQGWAAQLLLAELAGQVASLPEGPALEMGCGTGLLSAGLAGLLPERECWFTDLSPVLLEVCRGRVGAAQHRHWQVMDGERGPEQQGYALIISGMALHWFADWRGALRRWVGALRPGGLLACSFQEGGSFPEWRAQCDRLGLPCTANPFPALEEMRELLGSAGRCWAVRQGWRHASARDFFRSLKATGAATPLKGEPLGAGVFRRLLGAWDQEYPAGVEVTVSCGLAVVRRGAGTLSIH